MEKDNGVKDWSLLVWITQLGMSVAAPMAGFTLLGVWLKSRFSLGAWVVAVFCLIGLVSAADSFRITLKLLEEKERKKDKAAPRAFNDHK